MLSEVLVSLDQNKREYFRMKNSTQFILMVAILLMTAFLFLTACGVQTQPESASAMQEAPATTEASVVKQVPTPTAEILPTEASLIPVEELMNATYSGIYDELVTLTNGVYEGEPFVEGYPDRPLVEYVDGVELYGDLDGDGVEDTVAFLLENSGGTAVFTYVSAQLNRNGQPVDAGAAMVEDRTQVHSAVIEDGQVILDITTRGPGGGDCCPSYKTRKIYTLDGGRLVEVPAEEQGLVKISADDLNGTSWRLVELDENLSALADVEVTISFQEDKISGSGNCNSYSSSFGLGEDNPFIITIDPIAATKKACPDPIAAQENAYLTALENASLWGYKHGQLVLAYPDGQDGGLDLLLFTPQGVP